MPKAVKQVFGEFYYSMYYQLVFIPYTDPLLLNENESVTQSPFTIVFDRIGVAFYFSY